jgi:hypothetical protein
MLVQIILFSYTTLLPPFSMTAAIAALGAVVGYLGAEVAEETLFERLLWPQRFCNYVDTSTLLKSSFLMPMGGPLHRAALETLDKFRDHGIYRGRCRGTMLGTAIFAEQKSVTYYHRTAEKEKDRAAKKEVRNGFWIQVLRCIDEAAIKKMVANKNPDEESQTERARRAVRYVFRLHLDFCPAKDVDPKTGTIVSEFSITSRTIAGVFCSEITAVLFAVGIGVWSRFSRSADAPNVWLCGLLCISLFLKILAIVFTVRREELILPTIDSTRKTSTRHSSGDENSDPAILKSAPSSKSTPSSYALDMFEVDYPTLGFPIITAPVSNASLQFFRHYGHPLRDSKADRFREVMCILIVYAYVLNFPAGLIALSWMNQTTRYLWLVYQVYTIVAMHITRLGGWQGCGRTEERVAKALQTGKATYLLGSNGGAVRANLQVERVPGVAEGRARVKEILEQNLHHKS